MDIPYIVLETSNIYYIWYIFYIRMNRTFLAEFLEVKYEYFKHYFIDYRNFQSNCWDNMDEKECY